MPPRLRWCSNCLKVSRTTTKVVPSGREDVQQRLPPIAPVHLALVVRPGGKAAAPGRSAVGQSRTSADVSDTTASPSKADMPGSTGDVAEGPQPDSCAAAIVFLLDQLSGSREECARKSEVRRLRGLRVMTRSNFGWLLSGQIRGHLEPNHCRTKSSWHSYRCLPIRSLASIRIARSGNDGWDLVFHIRDDGWIHPELCRARPHRCESSLSTAVAEFKDPPESRRADRVVCR